MSGLIIGAARQPVRVTRFVTFRLFAVAVALLLIVGFGVWQSVLTPWVDLPDTADHGWMRTPEMHRLADSAAAAVMGSLGAAGVVLAVRPRASSGLTVWLVGMLALVGALSLVSSALQGHDLVGAALFVAAWLAVLVLPMAFFAPNRRHLLRGGAPAAETPGPRLTLAFGAVATIGALLSIVALGWRLTGGTVESPREDDVIGFVLFGLLLGLGGIQGVRGREGWRTLAVILGVVVAYAVLAAGSIVLR